MLGGGGTCNCMKIVRENPYAESAVVKVSTGKKSCLVSSG